DRLIEGLQEDARRDHLGRAGKPLPSHVDVADERPLEVGIADDGTAADDVGELEWREFTELGTVDRLAESESKVLAAAQVVDEVDGREQIRFANLGANLLQVAVDVHVEQVEGIDRLRELLDAQA